MDHRALRPEPVRDGGKQQEGRDQGQCNLAVDPVDAVRHLDRAGSDHAIESRARMPEEVERTQVSEHRVEYEREVDPEQRGMGQPRQFHHQQEHEQADDEILGRIGTLPPDRDVFVLIQEVDEGIDTDADVDCHQYVVDDGGQPPVQKLLLGHEQDLQDQCDRQQPGYQFLRAAVAGVAIPDHPDEQDQRKNKGQVLEIGVALEPVTQHGCPPCGGRRLSPSGPAQRGAANGGAQRMAGRRSAGLRLSLARCRPGAA